MRVGVLALQGGFAPHLAILEGLGHLAVEVRDARGCAAIEGLVVPGGESTALLTAMDSALRVALEARVAAGAPLLATCAGLILSSRATTPALPTFGWLDVDVARNGWGRQSASGIRRSDQGHERLLIRAPRVTRVGPSVEVLEAIEGEPIRVRSGNRVGAADHPELRGDATLHAAVFGHAVGGR